MEKNSLTTVMVTPVTKRELSRLKKQMSAEMGCVVSYNAVIATLLAGHRAAEQAKA